MFDSIMPTPRAPVLFRSLQQICVTVLSGVFTTCAHSAVGGHLAVLRWAREQGCPWNAATQSCAAMGGYLHVLQWAREHDIPWDEGTCEQAAVGGHPAVLRWAREHGCPWNEARVREQATAGGHVEMLT